MIPTITPSVDSRDTNALLAEFQKRRPGYLSRWSPPAKSAGAAIGPIFARFASAVLQRLNQAPAKRKLAFLDLLGLRLVTAQPARVPVVFSLTQGASDTSAPEGTQVAAPPPPGSSQQIVFSTEQDAAVAAATLEEVISLWPGRDQYINHSAALQAKQPFTLFQDLMLQQTDHILYLAHGKMLALSGTAHLKVTFDLQQGSSSPLDITWEYWDGQVWRGFITYQASCLDPAEPGHDGTNGLSTSGSVLLDVEGAQAAQTLVNGVNSYWIRGRLTEGLLPNPNKLLPEAETIRISTQIDRRMELNITASYSASSASTAQVVVLDECGQPLQNAVFSIAPDDGSSGPSGGVMGGADSSGVPIPIGPQPAIQLQGGATYEFQVLYNGITGSTYSLFNFSGQAPLITLMVKIEGLTPDKAFCDGKSLDLSKAFYPLGQSPIPGSTFYFKQNEAFSKPGAQIQVYVAPGVPPGGSLSNNPVAHTVNWEYWNGYEWKLLLQSPVSSAAAGDFNGYNFQPDLITFTVPADARVTTVNKDSGFWMRARLAAGGYGVINTIVLPTGSNPLSITYIQPQPPIVCVFRLGYSWTQGPYPVEQVLTYNDFQYEDHTQDALWPGNPFTPYRPVGDVTPTLFLGFSKKLPVDNYGLYFDIAEQAGALSGPALVWEYWNGGGWAPIPAEDETQQLALPGMITFIPAADIQPLVRFYNPLYWIRGRLKEDGPPVESTINNIYTNAVWASQWQTYSNSPLGASTGTPSQIFKFNQIPILPGQQIAVQELTAPRANSEWRSLAMQVVPNDPNIVTKLEGLLAAEGSQTDIVLGDIHLIRDKTKSVIAVWVVWKEVDNFFDSGQSDRVYVLDHAMGRLFFGNGDTGMIPPIAAAIQATSFRSGGGVTGNVMPNAVTQLLGSVPGVQGVTNPRAAEGGADGETVNQYLVRAPNNLRNRGRAIVPADYESMAQNASAGVAIARVVPMLNPSGITRPGWITIMIIPQSQDPRPSPSVGLRQEVLNYILQRAPADLAACGGITVVGPTYLAVDVSATIAPADPGEAGAVEQNVVNALGSFLHPLTGGPGGQGWDIGRGLYASDIASVLSNVDGVDYVERLALYVNGVLQGEQVTVPVGQIVVAGELMVSMVLPVTV